MRARTHIEDMDKGGTQAIIVDELPYQVNKAQLLIKIGELVREKRLEGIADLRDESDKSGMRVGDRAEARRGRRDRPEQPVQAHADAGDVRHEHGRARRRPAEAAEPEAVPRCVPAPPPRGGHAAHRLQPAQGARTRPRAGRPRRRAVQRGRGDRAHQGRAHARRRQGRAHGARRGARRWWRRCSRAPRPTSSAPRACRGSSACLGEADGLPPLRAAGAEDPRDAAAAPHGPRAGQDPLRVPRGDRHHRGPARHPRASPSASRRSSATSSRR